MGTGEEELPGAQAPMDPLTAEGIRRGQAGVKSRRRILRVKALHHGAKNCSRHLVLNASMQKPFWGRM